MQALGLRQLLLKAAQLRRHGAWFEAEILGNEISDMLAANNARDLSGQALSDTLDLLHENAKLYEQSGLDNKKWLSLLKESQELLQKYSIDIRKRARNLWKMHLCCKRMDYVSYHLNGEPHFHEALALFKDPSTSTDPTYLNLLGWYTAFRTGDLDKGLELMESAFNGYSNYNEPRLEDRAFTLQLLSLAYDEKGENEKLNDVLRMGMALSQKMQEPSELSELLIYASSRPAVDPRLCVEGLRWIEEHFGDRHPKLLMLRTALAARLENDAEPNAVDMLNPDENSATEHFMPNTDFDMSEMPDAETLWIDAIEKLNNPPAGQAIHALTGYGGYLERHMDTATAERLYRNALEIIEANFHPEPLLFLGPQPALALSALVSEQGRLEEALQLLQDFVDRQEADDYLASLDVEYALEKQIELLTQLGRPHEAEPLMRRLNSMQSQK